jgi:hypothetical protein
MFAEDRKAICAMQLFGDYHGVLQVDGYAAYKGLIKNGGRLVQLAFCFAHARRKFWDVHVATKSPIATETLQRIAMFYASPILGAHFRPADHQIGAVWPSTCNCNHCVAPDFMPIVCWITAEQTEFQRPNGLSREAQHRRNCCLAAGFLPLAGPMAMDRCRTFR